MRFLDPSKIEWDLTNGPLRKLLELLDSLVEGSVQWVLFEISWSGGVSESLSSCPKPQNPPYELLMLFVVGELRMV